MASNSGTEFRCVKHNEIKQLNLVNSMGGNWVCLSCERENTQERSEASTQNRINAVMEIMKTVPNLELTKIQQPVLPLDKEERKKIPIATGVLDYFPNALAEVAKVSYQGNVQHNAGQPLHWARNKSMDQDDTIIRHFLERGRFDEDGMRHTAKLAWRVLALLQLELEAEGAPVARGASYEAKK
jgi:Domain of unknown function (DUF5664)